MTDANDPRESAAESTPAPDKDTEKRAWEEEAEEDKRSKESFPASDPPASY